MGDSVGRRVGSRVQIDPAWQGCKRSSSAINIACVTWGLLLCVFTSLVG